jgi:hypothetical protein
MFLRGLSRLVPGFFLILLCACSLLPRDHIEVHYPLFENQLETEHFILRWTNASSHAADNVSDPEIVRETGEYFETAREKLTGLFGRAPYLPPGDTKMEVIFHDIECYAFADPPDGPIELNSSVWMKMPSIRQSTSAHELFHKLQYAYGYKTRWIPREPILWFTEGTAAWAEVFVWGRVSRSCKVEDMFKDTNIKLYEAEDMALPFWIYFVSGNSCAAQDQLMVNLFEKCEQEKGDVKKALFDVIREAYGSVDSFFLRFELERKNDFWQGAPSQSCNYTRIMGPDGRDLVTEIKQYQHRKHGSSAQ